MLLIKPINPITSIIQVISMTKTSIQVSDDIRRRLKILASVRDISYEDLLTDMLNLAESITPFKDMREFSEYFTGHPEAFGFRRVLAGLGGNRFRVEDINGVEKTVQLELFAGDYLRRSTREEVDQIVSAVAADDNIGGKPVASLVNLKALAEELKKPKAEKNVLIPIPKTLHRRLAGMIKDTGFSSVEDYVVFVMRELIASHEAEKAHEPYSEEDVERVKERLRSLGYL